MTATGWLHAGHLTPVCVGACASDGRVLTCLTREPSFLDVVQTWPQEHRW